MCDILKKSNHNETTPSHIDFTIHFVVRRQLLDVPPNCPSHRMTLKSKVKKPNGDQSYLSRHSMRQKAKAKLQSTTRKCWFKDPVHWSRWFGCRKKCLWLHDLLKSTCISISCYQRPATCLWIIWFWFKTRTSSNILGPDGPYILVPSNTYGKWQVSQTHPYQQTDFPLCLIPFTIYRFWQQLHKHLFINFLQIG